MPLPRFATTAIPMTGAAAAEIRPGRIRPGQLTALSVQHGRGGLMAGGRQRDGGGHAPQGQPELFGQ